jgi:flagellar hook-associated protein 1 FlgK
MSLLGVLNIGKSALAVQQASIQVTGNNISQAGNADYTRQVARTVPSPDQQIRPGVFVGTGVNLQSIQRQIDEALQTRLRGSISDNEGATTTQQWLGRVEATFNELSDDDLSSQMSAFFNSWSNLASSPQDNGLRQVVLQSGDTVAKWFQQIRGDLGSLQSDADTAMKSLTSNANDLAQQVADLNAQIVVAEGGTGGQANGLRDQRDAVLKQLAQLTDIKTVNGENGVVNVYIGSEPLVMGTQNRGLALRQQTVNGELVSTVVFKADGGSAPVTAGQIGAINAVRSGSLEDVINQVDKLAGNLIFELNKIHSSGQGLIGYSSITGMNPVDDPTAALNSAAANLPFTPSNGSFVVHVTNKATGQSSSTLIRVNLDGTTVPQTSLNSLASDLDSVDDISASVVGNELKIQTDSGDVQISFSQDSSGALAALGVGGFFTGKNAQDIAVSGTLRGNPSLLAAAKNGANADNQTALAISQLETHALAGLGGVSLKDSYQAMINGVAVASKGAKTNAEASQVVQETLEAQREALSGVSLDEEAINLMQEQRAFQGAARLVAAVDQMMQTILQLV